MSWHYQWTVLHDYLRGWSAVSWSTRSSPRSSLLPRRRLAANPARVRRRRVPVRPSQIRNDYVLNALGLAAALPRPARVAPIPASRSVDWSLFFDVPGHSPAQRAKRSDGQLARSLIELPVASRASRSTRRTSPRRPRSQARTRPRIAIRRGRRGGDGRGAARSGRGRTRGPGWDAETPLWYLRPARVGRTPRTASGSVRSAGASSPRSCSGSSTATPGPTAHGRARVGSPRLPGAWRAVHARRHPRARGLSDARGILPGHITATSRGVEGLARRRPRQPPRKGKGANSSRWIAWKM